MVPDAITDLLAPTVAGLGYELLGIERQQGGSGGLLRIYIDSPDGIGIEDCERVSRQVSDVLDAEDAVRGEYTLEVSSPGLDRPLFTKEQFRTHVGAEVSIRLKRLLDGRRKMTGTLISVDEDSASIRVDGEPVEIAFAMIERARLVPQW